MRLVSILLIAGCLNAAGVSVMWTGSKGGANTNASTTVYGTLGFVAIMAAGAPTAESSAQTLMRTSGTLSKFCTYFSTMDRGAGSVQMRKATSYNTSYSNTNLLVTLTAAGGAAEYCDNVNNDTVTAGEYWDWKLITGSGGTSSIIRHAGVVFAASTAGVTVSKYGGYLNGASAANNSTYPFTLAASVAATAGGTESFTRMKASTRGTWRNIWVNLLTNTFSTSGTLRSRVNGSNGNQAVSVGTTAGPIAFEDNVNSDLVQQGDNLNTQFVTSTGTGSATVDQIGTEFQTDNSSTMPVSSNLTSSGAGNATGASSTLYVIGGGVFSGSSTQPEYVQNMKVAAVASRLSTSINADALTAAQVSTAAVMKNGSVGNLIASFTSGAAVPAYIVDNVNADIFTTSDTFQFRLVIGSGTTLTVNNLSVLWSHPSPTMGPVTM